jgi:hypothetical protein
MSYKWRPGPDTKAAWIKDLPQFGGKTFFPMQNITSVSAGRNKDNREKLAK